MGYKADGKLADLFPDRFVTETAEEIADKVGDRLRARVAMRTPVARLPMAYHSEFEAWIQDRGGRLPRTMRDSWRRTEVIRTDNASMRVEVFSDEPPIDAEGHQIVNFVEEDTKPHLIRARNAKALRYPMGPIFRYGKEVHHPGTQGVHMMRDSLAEMDAMWIEVAQPILDRKAEEYSAR